MALSNFLSFVAINNLCLSYQLAPFFHLSREVILVGGPPSSFDAFSFDISCICVCLYSYHIKISYKCWLAPYLNYAYGIFILILLIHKRVVIKHLSIFHEFANFSCKLVFIFYFISFSFRRSVLLRFFLSSFLGEHCYIAFFPSE